MASIFIEPLGDASYDNNLWVNFGGAPVVVSDIVHSPRLRSTQFRANAAADSLGLVNDITDAGGRCSVWIYITALPSAAATVIGLQTTGTGTVVVRLRITSAGVLQVWDSAAQRGSNGSTLSTGQWYRLTFTWKIVASGNNTIKTFVNGTADITATNITITTTGSGDIFIGNASGNASFDLRMSDFYLDDSNANTDPGNIWVTNKRPVSNGTSNELTTQIGSGGSGYGTGHAPQVNERPGSDTNGWSISTTTKKTEEYNIEAVTDGDVDISSATIVDYMGWIRAKVDSTANSPLHNIILNGVASSRTMTTSAAPYWRIAGSTTYPAGTGTDIGMDAQFTTTPHLTSLLECGINIAYIPGTTQTIHELSLLGVGV